MSLPLSSPARLVMRSPLQLHLRPVAFETVFLEDGENLLAEKLHLRRVGNFLRRQRADHHQTDQNDSKTQHIFLRRKPSKPRRSARLKLKNPCNPDAPWLLVFDSRRLCPAVAMPFCAKISDQKRPLCFSFPSNTRGRESHYLIAWRGQCG